MRTLNVNEIEMVDGAVSNDAIFGAAIGVATAFAIGMTLPVSGPMVVGFWAASLISSAIAYNVQ